MRADERSRNESGAFAVLFALMVVMLLTVAALGTDLGNAISRKTDTQNQADFAAYTVGVEHPLDIAAGQVGSVPSPAIQQEVADYLNSNQPQDDDSPCWRDGGSQCVDLVADPDQLTDGDLSNGETRFIGNAELQVVAPTAKVDFGFANVFGASGTSVQSDATVKVFSAGPRMFPLFAMDSACAAGNYFHEGYTVVKETTGGGTPPPANPVLADPTDDNNTELAGIQVYDSGGTLQPEPGVVIGDHGSTIVVTGKKWNSVDVGFFREAKGAETAPVRVAQPIGFTATSSGGEMKNYAFTVPDVVADDEAWWYVRVRNEGSGPDVGWSPVNAGPSDRAQRFKVGNPEVIPGCAADASDQGNFGMVEMPRTDHGTPDATELAWNIADGVQDPMGLIANPNGTQNGGDCAQAPTASPAGANEAGDGLGTEEPEARVNCLTTITGLFKGVDLGLIAGPNGGPDGLLDASSHPTKPGCGSDFDVDVEEGSFSLNGESISCYFDSSAGVTMSQVADDAYSGPDAFDPEIFNSPRFGYVPIFTGDVNGGDTKSIVTFQAAFITDNPFYTEDDDTPGLYFTTKGSGVKVLKSVTMFLFSINALPDPPEGVELIDYLGVGKPIVHLID